MLKDMICRGLLLQLEAQGLITLPPPRRIPPHLLSPRKRPAVIEIDQSPLAGKVSDLKPIELHQVRRTPLEKLYRSLIEQYHYLEYTQPVGEHLEYLAMAQGRVMAGVGWCSAPRHIGCRDQYLGWTKEQRVRNLSLVVINTRFLILPWVKVSHLASYLLGRIARRIAHDWQRVYHHEVVWLETFVDPTRGFEGHAIKRPTGGIWGRRPDEGRMIIPIKLTAVLS